MVKQLLKGSARQVRLFSVYESPPFSQVAELQLRYTIDYYGFSIHPSKRHANSNCKKLRHLERKTEIALKASLGLLAATDSQQRR